MDLIWAENLCPAKYSLIHNSTSATSVKFENEFGVEKMLVNNIQIGTEEKMLVNKFQIETGEKMLVNKFQIETGEEIPLKSFSNSFKVS